MCQYSEILGSGKVFEMQMLTTLAIVLCILFWVWFYRKNKVDLKRFVTPISLWIIFGTLDILVTTKGTFNDPLREGNILAQVIFLEFGDLGPIVASVSWIALWAGLVFVMNKKKIPYAEMLTLVIFYSLTVGHFLGFSSWFIPFCIFSQYSVLLSSGVPKIAGIVFSGILLSILHSFAKNYNFKR